MLKALIGNEFYSHIELANSDRCSNTDNKYYYAVVNHEQDEVGLSRAFDVLSRMLCHHYVEKVIIIIDEYDIPIIHAI